jgi:hypothetical protein
LIRLAMKVATKQPVAPAVFVTHKLITSANVDAYYPNDLLLQRTVV